MRRAAPVASFTTMGHSKPDHLTQRKNYTYNGDKPYRGPDTEKVHVPNPKGGIFPDSHERKEKRLTAFLDALNELGGLYAPRKAVVEAGKRIGIGERTALNYRAELRRRRREAEPS